MKTWQWMSTACVVIVAWSASAADSPAPPGTFQAPATWEYGPPLIAPEQRANKPSKAQKDPTVVFHDNRWHVFMTVKLPTRTAIEYCSFEKWEQADKAPRTLLKVSSSRYFGAPQVFYFAPQKKWYLVYQAGMDSKRKMMWVAYSTTTTLADPASWTQAQPMLDGGETDPRVEGGLDYWIICDETRAYLFFTSLNGKLWRLWTPLDQFPRGFGNTEIALKGPFFEASHTYKIKNQKQYLTIVEENGQRHYKAYVASELDGKWEPLAATFDKPFAGAKNIRPGKTAPAWTDNVSHGELIRVGADQTMTLDPENLQFLFQGMLEKDKGGKNYGQFQWRIGLLTAK